MILTHTKQEVGSALSEMREAGQRIALVPTMGYLHQGHLALVDRAAELADRVVLSIFVNPLQFAPSEDLDRYPRNLERDLTLARERGVDLVFAPPAGEMYPSGPPEVTVDPGGMARRLCGAYRPDHFRGVLTVVLKLFSIFTPAAAVFGRKDFQQAVLIRRMVRDLDLDVHIDVAPIIREEDGLAMSSRNALLSDEARAQAPMLYSALLRLRERARQGETRSKLLLAELAREVEDAPLLQLQYAEIVHPDTLEPEMRASPGSVVAVAVHAGEVRLIDNLALE